jgi:hypothetical protein
LLIKVVAIPVLPERPVRPIRCTAIPRVIMFTHADLTFQPHTSSKHMFVCSFETGCLTTPKIIVMVFEDHYVWFQASVMVWTRSSLLRDVMPCNIPEERRSYHCSLVDRYEHFCSEDHDDSKALHNEARLPHTGLHNSILWQHKRNHLDHEYKPLGKCLHPFKSY